MSYTPQLVVAPYVGALANKGGLCGMPSAPFRYLLYSVVVCLPSGAGSSIVGFSNSTTLGSWAIDSNKVSVGLTPGVSQPLMLNATLAHSAAGVRSHLLISIDSVAQVLQVYVNDTPLAITTGGWTGSGTMTISTTPGISTWVVTGAGSWSAAPGGGPGVADLWMAAPASFYDLTVVANRRRFINADLSLVDLGVNGSEPLGVAAPIFLTVRPGDTNAGHFVSNNGTGGAFTQLPGSIAFEPGGVCIVPTIIVPPTGSLALDDVVAIDQTPERIAGTQIFLIWSDDRGHSWGNPVGQPIGQTGEYLTTVQYQRLGYARDRVFKLEWSVPVATALLGAYLEVDTNPKS